MAFHKLRFEITLDNVCSSSITFREYSKVGPDIEAITVNRWPHGYAYEYNRLLEPLDQPAEQRPYVVGRQPFGRITIANSDSDGHAYTNIAIDQGYRAIQEVMAMRHGG